jgi:hypothetical protein
MSAKFNSEIVVQNAKSALKSRMSASPGSRHWPHTLTEARCFCSQMAKRRRGLFEAVNRIVSGENFWGGVAWGDQDFLRLRPRGYAPCSRPPITDNVRVVR